MADQNIDARLARMEEKQAHIVRVVDRIEASERDMRARIISLEGQERRMEGIPAQVAKNDKNNAVQEAMREAREHLVSELKRTVALFLGVPSAVVALTAVAALVSRMGGGQ